MQRQEWPSKFRRFYTSGDSPATSSADDYNRTAPPERRIAFLDELEAGDDAQREGLARDRNIVLGGSVVATEGSVTYS